MGLFKPPLLRPPRQAKSPFKFPTLEDRLSIVGHTGSGKTQFGGWLLSEANFDKQPFVIIDAKREKLFRGSDLIRAIGYDELPKQPGVYRLEILPHEQDEIERFLWKVWNRALAGDGTGLFFDEGYLVNKYNKAWRALYVAGRSLNVPIYTLSQRPVDLPLWSISEANYHAVFNLNRDDDREIVYSYIPKQVKDEWGEQWPHDDLLPNYHSRWYDGRERKALLLGPAPDADVILQRFEDRLRPRVKAI